jgi:hypothetical protein
MEPYTARWLSTGELREFRKFEKFGGARAVS